jgi:hypothetical protein
MVTNWGPVSKKPQRFADGLEVAVETDGPRAVPVAEKPAVVSGDASYVGSFDRDGQCLCLAVAGFDGLGNAEGWRAFGVGRAVAAPAPRSPRHTPQGAP